MQRMSYILLCLTALITVALPSQAQGGSIASFIEQRSDSGLDFTILQQFIELSDLETELGTSGTYTLFAPTDNAFERLEGAIDFSIEDLLSSQEIINAIVRYHTIDSQLSASQLRASDGRVIQTELPNAFMGIIRARDNTIVINNVVEVTGEDIAASNGVIHEINDVLLNRVINDLLISELGEPATPAPSPSPTEAPAGTTTPEPESRSTANVRIAHLATGAPDIALTLGGIFTSEDISYQTVTDFRNIPQGIYTATVVSLDEDDEFAIDLDLTLLNGDFVTLALVNTGEDTVELVAFTDDLRGLDEDEARIVLFNALPESPAVSLIMDGNSVFEGVSSGERETDNVDGAIVALQLVATRNDSNSYYESDEEAFDEGGLYWVILSGTDTDPSVIVAGNDAAQIQQLSMAMPEAPTTTGQTTATATPVAMSDSIVDILDDAENFTLLIQALASADSDILNILGNPDADAVTFLAPDDTAFANLLATTGLSEARLIRNPDLLNNILRYHIIENEFTSDDFIAASGTSIITSLDPAQAFFVRATDDGRIFLNGTIEFVETDLRAANGIIHVVDDVLLPLSVIEALDL